MIYGIHRSRCNNNRSLPRYDGRRGGVEADASLDGRVKIPTLRSLKPRAGPCQVKEAEAIRVHRHLVDVPPNHPPHQARAQALRHRSDSRPDCGDQGGQIARHRVRNHRQTRARLSLPECLQRETHTIGHPQGGHPIQTIATADTLQAEAGEVVDGSRVSRAHTLCLQTHRGRVTTTRMAQATIREATRRRSQSGLVVDASACRAGHACADSCVSCSILAFSGSGFCRLLQVASMMHEFMAIWRTA